MYRRTGSTASPRLLESLALVLSCPFAASPAAGQDPTPATPEQEQQALLDELDEVVVSGAQPVKTTQQLINWLANLGGKFTVEGNVDLQGKGDPVDLKPVTGAANCVAFGLAPGIRCGIEVRWPETRDPAGGALLGGVSTFDPGMILFGIEPRGNAISHMFVDNKGVGEHALGLLFNDTLISRTACVNIPGTCERTVRITIEPDVQVIRMQIDYRRDHRAPVSFGFVLRRVPGSQADVLLGTPR